MLGIGHVVAQFSSPAQAREVSGFPLTRRPALPDATLSRKGRGFNFATAVHRAIFQVVSISPVMGFFASIRAMPIATSSSLIRSASAQFFAFRAASRAFFSDFDLGHIDAGFLRFITNIEVCLALIFVEAKKTQRRCQSLEIARI